jgi:DNA polymerase
VASTSDAADRRDRLVEVFHDARACERCPLAATRTQVVFGSGNADAELMFIGEAPGAREDEQGLPFVGRAGELLNQLIGEIGLRREDVFVANTVKCRPPGNRDPLPAEIEACNPYLQKQIDLIQPSVIATLGNFATKLVTASPAGITRVRGRPQQHVIAGREVTVVPLFHPAAALRTPKLVDDLRADMRVIADLLGRQPEAAPAPVRGAEAQPGLFGATAT